jgi:hypothetical protein
MSYLERNNGRLYPIWVDTENFDDEAFEAYEENGYMVIDREIYRVDWDVKSSQSGGFSDVKVGIQGIIHFHTMHHNGGASLSEVIEDALCR